jgi:L-2-hydroxyglutarate oxidase LhgO
LEDVDCIVIGAGVIGLAAARALALTGREVFILERERHFGMHTSSRNSEVRFAKGSYFALSGASPFSRLIYPVPREGGYLGIHMTLDLGGSARFGPDTQWVDNVDYTVDPLRMGLFVQAVRQYWPALDESRLHPAYAGIRPKISAPGEPTRDFDVSAPSAHGVAGIVNLFGMESPGLTASLALGDYIAGLAD